MTWSDLPLRPSDRALRQFAGLCLAVFGGMAAWQYFVRHNPVAAAILAGLALAVGPLGLARPRAVRPVFVAWMVVAFPIGWAVSTALLAALFYGVFTPLGLLFRLAGRDPLRLRPQPAAATYWTPKPAAADVRRYFQQF